MAATNEEMEEFQLAPEKRQRVEPELKKFFDQHLADGGRKMVLITSGGTTVPLEKNTVRYIDNFSAGTRGAASAEYFLRAGYAVIFLYRHNSLVPFDRHFRKGNNILGLFKLTNGDQSVEVDQSKMPNAVQVMKEFVNTQRDNRYLAIDFITLHEYLSLLGFICERLKPFGRRALVYCAAAVSDFFIPTNELPIHKIQSADGPLNLQLKLTPKMLKPFVIQAVPDAFVVSFKLETDPEILEKKARASLASYHHQLVIGNILDRRKYEVLFVTMDSCESISIPQQQRDDGKTEIEQVIVDRLAKLHEAYCAR